MKIRPTSMPNIYANSVGVRNRPSGVPDIYANTVGIKIRHTSVPDILREHSWRMNFAPLYARSLREHSWRMNFSLLVCQIFTRTQLAYEFRPTCLPNIYANTVGV